MNVSHLDQYEQFELYSRALIESRDVDPIYPVVKEIINYYEFDPEWFVFCYVAFYNLGTGITMCKEMPTRAYWDASKFSQMRTDGTLKHFGHERRGTQRRLDNQIEMFNTIVRKWLPEWEELQDGLERYDVHDHYGNLEFRKDIESLPNHGSWAAYKIAELFEKSLDYRHLTIPDLGLEDKDFSRNDGPTGGLRWIFDSGRTLENQKTGTIDFSKNKPYWLPIFNKFGEELSKAWGVDMGEVETCLCKWHKMKKGAYFIGHDIAELIELEEVMGKKVYEKIMTKCFDYDTWKSLREFPTNHKTYFRDKGMMLGSYYAKKLPKIDVKQILLNL